MTGRYALIDTVARWRWYRRPASRRGVFAIAAIVLALLSAFPRRYVAELQFTTQEGGSGGLSALLGQLGGVFGGVASRQSIEQVLAVSRSYAVRAEVVRRLGLARPEDAVAMQRAVRRLDGGLSVRVQRGSIIDVELFGHDPDAALRTVATYSDVVRLRLADLARATSVQKRAFLDERYRDVQARVTAQEAAIDRYRRTNNLLAPAEQLGSGIGRTVGLQGALQAKQIQLEVALRSHSDDSFEVRTIRAEMAAIAGQIRRAEAQGSAGAADNPANLSTRIYEYGRLTTELGILQTQLQSLRRYLEASTIEEMSADMNMQVVQPAYLEPGMAFNPWPMGLLILVLLLGLAAEFHALKPPPGTPPALA